MRAVRANGAKVTLSNGREYLDLMNGKGCITLGHHHPVITEAIVAKLSAQTGCATCWSDSHEELAELITADCDIPDARLAFFSTGTEACRAAVQAARAFTRRHLIASSGYHGWDDHWSRASGLLRPNTAGVIDFFFIPALLADLLDRYRGKVAMVIVSPDYVHLKPETLGEIARIAREHDVIFCCDDVKQGYRSCIGSALPHVAGVTAHLYTFAKGLANGQRLSCLVGRQDILIAARDLTYTAYFDTIPIVASLATLQHMRAADGHRQLVSCGASLARGMRAAIAKSGLPVAIFGDGPMLQIVSATADLDDRIYEESAAAGLLLYEGDNQAISLATVDAVDEIVARFETALDRVAAGADSIEAGLISPGRQFRAAFNMIDGATDAVPPDQAIRWVERML